MIPPSLYVPIYLILVTLFTIATYLKYKNRIVARDTDSLRVDIKGLLLVFVCTLFIGLRPVSARYFGDMEVYVDWYADYVGVSVMFDLLTDNLIFDNLIAWWGSQYLGYTSFFILIAAIYFMGTYWGIRKLFPNDRIAAYLVFLAAFSTFSYATNGIKAGAAASLFIMALGYRDNLKICIPLILISWGFHHSMIMPVAAFVVTLLVKNPRIYFIGWAFCFLMAAAHVTAFQHLFAGATTEHGATYLLTEGGNEGTKGGFRIDFIIYSAIPVFIGWYAIVKKKLQISDKYRNLLNLYLCLNSIWMLCMYANFTNRIAYLSWFLYPIVLIYPFLNENWGKNRYKMFGLVMLGHLGFTLFMNILYY